MFTELDCNYMKRALELAVKARGYTSPNPMVGAVIVKDGRIIGEGYHERYGELHAERNALKNCIESPAGATMYVTLEPCCHYGKTPPCTEAIIDNGIKKVYVGCTDDNPLVASKGIDILKEHGIEVEVGLLEEECRKINEVFLHYIKEKKPYIVMKYAMTLDGKISTYTGDSKWITSADTREHVHTLRGTYRGIMVGIGTVLADNPMLNCRINNMKSPVRIVCDSMLRIPLDCNIVNTANEYETIIACAKFDNKDEICNETNGLYNSYEDYMEKYNKLTDKGIQIIEVPCKQDDNIVLDMNYLFEKLGELKIDSVLVEGGSEIHGYMLQNKLVNKVYAYIAPKLIGGRCAKGPVGLHGFERMCEALELEDIEFDVFEKDILISGIVK